jgi:hypothetical protein
MDVAVSLVDRHAGEATRLLRLGHGVGGGDLVDQFGIGRRMDHGGSLSGGP